MLKGLFFQILLALWVVLRAAAQDGSGLLSLPWPAGVAYRMTQRPHDSNGALDFNGAAGTSVEVVAAREGVTRAGGCAHSIWVDHEGGWSTLYYHLQNIQVGPGVVVNRGQLLGYTSMETCSSTPVTGPHVHFSVNYNGVPRTTVGLTIGGWQITAAGMSKNGVNVSDGGSVYNDGMIGSGDAAQTPLISGVSPAVPLATGTQQPFTIFGSNFSAGASVTLRDSTNTYTDRVVSSRIGSSQITITPNFGANPDNWSVEVLNGAVSSGRFSFSVIPVGTAAAGKPTNLSPPSGSSNLSRYPRFTWTPGGNTSSFRIYLGTSPDLGSGTPTQIQTAGNAFFQPEDLSFGTTYYFRVDAASAVGSITTGDVWSFTTQAAPPPLATKASSPSPAVGSSGEMRNLNLSWTAGENTALFKIYLGKNPTLTAADLVSTQGIQFPVFPPDTLNFATVYYWRVDSLNATGEVTIGDLWNFRTGDQMEIQPGDPVRFLRDTEILSLPAAGGVVLKTAQTGDKATISSTFYFRRNRNLPYDNVLNPNVLWVSAILEGSTPSVYGNFPVEDAPDGQFPAITFDLPTATLPAPELTPSPAVVKPDELITVVIRPEISHRVIFEYDTMVRISGSADPFLSIGGSQSPTYSKGTAYTRSVRIPLSLLGSGTGRKKFDLRTVIRFRGTELARSEEAGALTVGFPVPGGLKMTDLTVAVGGGLRANLVGAEIGHNYSVEYSSNLIQWIAVKSITANSDSVIIDLPARAGPVGFYRVAE